MIPTSRTWPRIRDSPNCSIRIQGRTSNPPTQWAKKSLFSPITRKNMESKTAEYGTRERSARAGGLRVVAIGGGTGLSTLLKGLKRFVLTPAEAPSAQTAATWIRDLCAVVTVSDDGGSSGRLRKELNMLPPGDIRNCLVAVSEDESLLSKLFQHRFK